MSDDTLMFPMNSVAGATQCIDITITDDDLFEGNEIFIVELMTHVMEGNNYTTITILNDEGYTTQHKIFNVAV